MPLPGPPPVWWDEKKIDSRSVEHPSSIIHLLSGMLFSQIDGWKIKNSAKFIYIYNF